MLILYKNHVILAFSAKNSLAKRSISSVYSRMVMVPKNCAQGLPLKFPANLSVQFFQMYFLFLFLDGDVKCSNV